MKARENPFRTERVESVLTFRPEWLGQTWESIVERWQSMGCRGSIVGPHGSGKTTFLESLAPRLESLGYRVQCINLCGTIAKIPVIRTDSVLLLDSRGRSRQDRFQRLAEWNVRRCIERRLNKCQGVIDTRHHRGRRAVLLRTKATPEMLSECIRLVNGDDFLSREEVLRLFRTHRGNIRDALRDCYDRVTECDRVVPVS